MLKRVIYTLLLWLLLPLVLLRLLWRSLRQPEYLRHIGERFGFYPSPITHHPSPVIWLHCVSVGETRAAVPLVAALQQRYPNHTLLLTHGTLTGRTTSEQLFGDSVLRCYLPYDLPFAVARFLRHYRPSLGLLMETELWFNLVHACRQRHIPLLLVNARLSEKSARGYARLGRLTREALESLSAIAAQTETDASRLRRLGAQNITVTGNLKFDAAQPEAQPQRLEQINATTRPVFLAASTRNGEEMLILDAIQTVQVANLLTIIVPRHPQRFDEVAALLEKRGFSFVRRSALSNAASLSGVQVVLGDSMGELAAYYSSCTLTLIGGSLLPYGGQNLIEACALGKPVLIGAHTYNFAEAALQAVLCGAARRVNNAAELAQALETLLDDPTTLKRMGEAGERFCAENRGSTQRVLPLVEKQLP